MNTIEQLIEDIERVATEACEQDPDAFSRFIDDHSDPRPGYGGFVSWFRNIHEAVTEDSNDG